MAGFNEIFGKGSETSEGLKEETNEHTQDEPLHYEDEEPVKGHIKPIDWGDIDPTPILTAEEMAEKEKNDATDTEEVPEETTGVKKKP